MDAKNDPNAHAAFGDTDCADSVPDRFAPSAGPVYLEGRLVLSLSFRGELSTEQLAEGAGDLVERYRLWDDLAEAWYGDALEVLRFELGDVVVRRGTGLPVLWEGAVDTHARVVPEPDLDEAGMAANRGCDLCWKRV